MSSKDKEMLDLVAVLAAQDDIDWGKPVNVRLWDEVDGKGEWRVIGRATTDRGLRRVMIKALAAQRQYGRSEWDRPFLPTGGPRLGTIKIVNAALRSI